MSIRIQPKRRTIQLMRHPRQQMPITRVCIKRGKSPKKPLSRHPLANPPVAHNISHTVITNKRMPENRAINPTTHPQQNNNANNPPHPPNITHSKPTSKPPMARLEIASSQTPVTSNTALPKIFSGTGSPPFTSSVVNKQTPRRIARKTLSSTFQQRRSLDRQHLIPRRRIH